MSETIIRGSEFLGIYDDRQLKRLVEAAMPVIFEVSHQELTKFVTAVETYVAERRFGPVTRPRRLRNRSGHLRSSVYSEVTGSRLDQLEGAVGATAKYAARHEFGSPGGRPPGATTKHAAIPLEAAMTAAGVVNVKPREVQASFFVRSKAGHLFLMGESPTGKATPFFLLVPWEKLGPTPPRLGIRDTLDKGLPRFLKKYGNRLTKEIQELVGG